MSRIPDDLFPMARTSDPGTSHRAARRHEPKLSHGLVW